MDYSFLAHRIKKIILFIFAFIIISSSSHSFAEQLGILYPGSAVVTAFSGTLISSDPAQLFNPNGPSVRVIRLPAGSPFGLREVQKAFTVINQNIGQVFGVAVDRAEMPNIYVAATSAYGLAIYIPGQGRVKQGAAGAQFMTGQFGPKELGGGPQSIWRIDGATGQVTLFATVTYNGIENTPASLGALAFDPVSQHLFVSDRATGMIHSFSLEGKEESIYDHGTQGLSAVGQQPVPFDASTLASINHPAFNTDRPDTWGYAPLARRVFALAIYNQRLYYSVANNQIWSVSISAGGAFGSDARIELNVPPLVPNTEISSMTFDEIGYLYIAERGFPTGDYQFINVANSGQNRVKRFQPKMPDASSPFYWYEMGDEYSIGMYPEYQNSNGGVAVTCGRQIWMTGDHLLDDGTNGNFPHINGLQGNDKSLVKPANMPPLQSWFVNDYDYESDPNSRGYMGALVTLTLCHNGFGGGYQSPPMGLIPPICVPRIIFFMSLPPYWLYQTLFNDSWMNDSYCGYDCYTSCYHCPPYGEWPWGFNPGGLGMGPGFWGNPGGASPGIWVDPVPGANFPEDVDPFLAMQDPDFWLSQGFWGLSFNAWGGFGFGGGGFGFSFQLGWGWGPVFQFGNGFGFYDGYCTLGVCLPQFDWSWYGFCYPNCFGYPWGYCYPGFCPPYYEWPMFDYCNCPYFDGPCIPPPPLCPPEYIYLYGECVPENPPPPVTPPTPPQTTTPPTPPQTVTPPQTTTPPPRIQTFPVPPQETCSAPLIMVNGHCVTPPRCTANQILVNGVCVTQPICGKNQRLVNGHCVTQPTPTPCPNGQYLVNGRCVTKPYCRSDQYYINGQCVTKPRCATYQRWVNGRCVTISSPTICRKGQVLRNGICITAPTSTIICRKGQVLRNGICIVIPTGSTSPGIYCPSGYVRSHGTCIKINSRPKYQTTPSYYYKPKSVQPSTRYPSTQSKPSTYIYPSTQSKPSIYTAPSTKSE